MALSKRKRTFGSAEIWTLFREAGYIKPTYLQQRLVPVIMKGRDVAVEAEGDSGKTAAFILPLLVKLKRGKPGIKALVLTSTSVDSHKVYGEFRRFVRARKTPSIFALGQEGSGKKDHRILSAGPDVVIGTPNRVIDHIRRGNLDFSSLHTVIIDKAGSADSQGFAEDVLFIFSKLPQKRQTVLIAAALDGESALLVSHLKRPTLMPAAAWRRLAVPVRDFFVATEDSSRLSALADLVVAQPMESLLIQTSAAGEVKAVVKALKERHLEVLALLDTQSAAQAEKISQAFSLGKVPILVSTFAAAGKKNLRWVTHVINLDLPPNPESYKPRSFVLEQVTTLAGAGRCERLKETANVQPEKRELPTEDQVLRSTIKAILSRIKEEEDPEILNRFRRSLRANVPLFLRSYFAAYLLKQSLPERAAKSTKFAKLFLSVGKNRKIFARDLIELFMQRLSASRSQLREIKVLENYSFVEVDAALADRAIKELSGIEINGRTLSVNYARKREEKRERGR